MSVNKLFLGVLIAAATGCLTQQEPPPPPSEPPPGELSLEHARSYVAGHEPVRNPLVTTNVADDGLGCSTGDCDTWCFNCWCFGSIPCYYECIWVMGCVKAE